MAFRRKGGGRQSECGEQSRTRESPSSHTFPTVNLFMAGHRFNCSHFRRAPHSCVPTHPGIHCRACVWSTPGCQCVRLESKTHMELLPAIHWAILEWVLPEVGHKLHAGCVAILPHTYISRHKDMPHISVAHSWAAHIQTRHTSVVVHTQRHLRVQSPEDKHWVPH